MREAVAARTPTAETWNMSVRTASVSVARRAIRPRGCPCQAASPSAATVAIMAAEKKLITP